MSEIYPSYNGDSGATTHLGLVRKVNEDTFSSKPSIGLWLVADGMGGHSCGAVASKIARDTVDRSISCGHGLYESIQFAHNNIVKKAKENEDFRGMGSTIVAVLLSGADYEVAWLGDSRAYLWDGHLTRLTRDHSYVMDLVESGTITQEEANIHPSRHFITRCLGYDSTEEQLEIDVQRGRFLHGQELLLCSDGLTDELTDTEIEEIVAIDAPAQVRTDSLVKMAVDSGGNDNITVVLMTAPKCTLDATTQNDVGGLIKNVKLVLVGALLAVPLLGLMYYLR